MISWSHGSFALDYVHHFFLWAFSEFLNDLFQDIGPPDNSASTDAINISSGPSKNINVGKNITGDEKADDDFDDDAFEPEVTFRSAHQRKIRPATAMPAVNRQMSGLATRVDLPISTPNFQIGKVNIVILKQVEQNTPNSYQ
jgi:hypothetical protein